jgi:hypothetical protein
MWHGSSSRASPGPTFGAYDVLSASLTAWLSCECVREAKITFGGLKGAGSPHASATAASGGGFAAKLLGEAVAERQAYI